MPNFRAAGSTRLSWRAYSQIMTEANLLIHLLAACLGLGVQPAPAVTAQESVPGGQEVAPQVAPQAAESPRALAAFRALECLGNDPKANKEVAIPGLRASRAPRRRVGTIGDVTEWRPGTDLVKRDLESIVPKGYSQWSSNLHKKGLRQRGGSYTWVNIGVTAAPDARQLKWGTRDYNCPDRIFRDCDFTRIPQEHGLYVANYGDTTLERCTFLRVGSQGAQWAHRPIPYQQYDADCLPYQKPPVHIVRDSHFVDCGFKGTRPSFNLTYFDPGSSAMPGTLLVENSSFVSCWPEARGDGSRSTGALVLAHMSAAPALDAEVGPMMKSVTLRNVLFDFTRGDRPIAEIRSSAELVIEDCAFIARNHSHPFVLIDRDYSGNDLGGTKTERIVLRNNRSKGATLRLCLQASVEGASEVEIPLDCPGEELVYSGVTGNLISRRKLEGGVAGEAPEGSTEGSTEGGEGAGGQR